MAVFGEIQHIGLRALFLGFRRPLHPRAHPHTWELNVLVRTTGPEVATVTLAALLDSITSSVALLDSGLGKTNALCRLLERGRPPPSASRLSRLTHEFCEVEAMRLPAGSAGWLPANRRCTGSSRWALLAHGRFE
jgi:hypothetical protein